MADLVLEVSQDQGLGFTDTIQILENQTEKNGQGHGNWDCIGVM